ncbi:hypothetical protein [Paenarthrobacter sp. TA1.8]|uniref:hypothetical protein n=1 Tax=Paenarthrobacter sp. TA1.8 TaxID=3400219 RepID=UPI003B4309E4
MRKLLPPLIVTAMFLTACSQTLKDTDPAGYEACIMLDRSRDKSVNVDERLELAIFTVGERAAQANTQAILDGIEKADKPAGLEALPDYTVKDSLADTCRDLGVPVRDIPRNQ